jgi:hypothetical protein
MKTIGLKIKSGFAIAAVLTEEADRTAIDLVRTVQLSSDAMPQSRFPYHPTIEMSEREGAATSRRAVDEVRRVAAREMRQLLKDANGVERAALVVGSTIDPDKLGNPHVRVHALEGKLFREVVVEALAEKGVDCTVLLERNAYEQVAADVCSTEARVRDDIAALGHGKVKPWRAEEKLATLAAWWRMRK